MRWLDSLRLARDPRHARGMAFWPAALVSGLLAVAAQALEAPYLIDVEAASATSIQVAWRNNDLATAGYDILRRDPGDSGFTSVAQVPAPATSFTDSGLRPSSVYEYAVVAWVSGAHSDWSRILACATLDRVPRFAAPTLTVQYDSARGANHIRVLDSSNAESGYRVLRSIDFGPWEDWRAWKSLSPDAFDTLTYEDAGVRPNSWYAYKAELAGEADSTRTGADTLFTFHPGRWLALGEPEIRLGSKLGGIPLQPGNWALRKGDSIFVHETFLDHYSYSIFDVSGAGNPVFKGIGQLARKICPDGQCMVIGDRMARRIPGSQPSRYALWLGRFDGKDFVGLDSIDIRSSVPSAGSWGEVWDRDFMFRFKEPFQGDSVLLLHMLYSSDYRRETAVAVAIREDKLSQANSADFFYWSAGSELTWKGLRDGFAHYAIRSYSPIRETFSNKEFIADFRRSPENPVKAEIPVGSFAGIPYRLEGLAYRDTMLAAASSRFLDPLRKRVYAIHGGELSVHAYSTGTGAIPILQEGSADPGRAGNRFLRISRNNGQVTLSFQAGRGGPCRLAVLDAKGRLIALLLGGRIPAGKQSLVWDRNAAPGASLFAWLELDGRRYLARIP